jgi:hypothetical protein
MGRIEVLHQLHYLLWIGLRVRQDMSPDIVVFEDDPLYVTRHT